MTNDILSLKTLIDSVANQVTETDRKGFEKVYVFNSTGNMTNKKEYTNLNLRTGEPDYYETVYTYNSDSLLLTVKYPRGNGVEYPMSRRPPLAGPPAISWRSAARRT